MDYKAVITCPHGDQTVYKYFRWLHRDEDMTCKILSSSNYEKVASAYYRRKKVEEALLEPDYSYLVTPEGVEAVCEWLTEGGAQGDANVQFQRMVMLVKSPVFIVLGRTMRLRVRLFQRNMRYLTKEAGVRDVKWLGIRLPVLSRKMFDVRDIWKEYPSTTSASQAMIKVRDALGAHRTRLASAAAVAAQEMRDKLKVRAWEVKRP